MKQMIFFSTRLFVFFAILIALDLLLVVQSLN